MPYHTREWVEAAISLGHDVLVLTAINPTFLKGIGWDTKVKLVQVPYHKGFFRNLRFFYDLRKSIKREIENFQPDILYERFSFASLAMSSINLRKISYCVEINGIVEEEKKLSPARFFFLRVIKFIEARVFSRADSIIAVTDNIKKWIQSEFETVGEKIEVIPNGVNPCRFIKEDLHECRKKWKIPNNAFVIGYLGSLMPWQDLDLLIESAEIIRSQIPNVFFMVGGGQEPMKSELTAKVKSLGMESIFSFPGQVHWDEASGFISCFDIAVSIIKYNDIKYEVSPLKTASYLACSKPVVYTDLPGEMQVSLSLNKVGVSYEKGKKDSFVEAIMKLYTMEDSQKEEMGDMGRKIIIKDYSWENLVRRTLEFILRERKL
jgi:glycosyltransferase involved in cell wall biosynthesis